MPRFRVDDADTPVSVPGWTSISGVKPDSANSNSELKKQASEDWTGGEKALSELLQCDHVMVLAGMGTSLSIKRVDGTPLFPTMAGLWTAAQTAIGAPEFEKIRTHVNHTSGENIEDLLSRCLMAVELASTANPSASDSPDISGFIRKAEKTIREACRQELNETDTTTHEEFLRRLTRRASRRPRACLFTTNYDQCFDVAAARIGLTVIDGFSFSVPPRFAAEMFDYDIVTSSSYSREPDFVPRLLRLFKLHGSVDWHKVGGAIEKDAKTDRPLLIYPQSGKYASSYSPPFLELMARFQGMLRNRNVGLLVACSGFNDLHLAEPVLAAIKSNPSLRLVVCAPDLCDADAQKLHNKVDAKGTTNTNSVLRQINQLVEIGDSRITLVNGFFPDIVKLMPTLPVRTDSEQHEGRIKALESWVDQQKADQGAIN